MPADKGWDLLFSRFDSELQQLLSYSGSVASHFLTLETSRNQLETHKETAL